MTAMSLVVSVLLGAAAPDLRTRAEQSSFAETGRYAEVERLCGEFAAQYPDEAHCLTFGQSPEGRPLLALVASADGALAPETLRAKGRPVVLVQGGIHAGEIDGKDAGFLALRDLLDKKVGKGLLGAVTLVFVPVFNVDGHERFGPNQRVNQVGPREIGWRTTAQNFNLNRDYAKADAPEMVALLGLLNRYDPLVYVDLHVTDGAQFRHRVAYLVEPMLAGDEGLRKAGKTLRDEVVRALGKAGHLPIGEFYPSFDKGDDPTSGFSAFVAPPRFSSGYWAARNRIGVLVETHAWKDYPTRVKVTYDCIVATLIETARHGKDWMAKAAAADRATGQGSLAGQRFALTYAPTGASRTLEFQGVAYERVASEISGGTSTVYHPDRAAVWKVPFRYAVKPVVEATLPSGGYLVPAAHAAWMAPRLRAHGIEVMTLSEAQAPRAVEQFRATTVELGGKSFEGRQSLAVQGTWTADSRGLFPGDLFVPIAQAKARLVAHLFEPSAPDSFLAWGFFNAHFERKEYMEAYVAEAEAAKMLAADPALAQAFRQRLADDAAFAKDPAARLDFFYQRHASFDAQFGLYPVRRLARAP